MFGKRVFLLPSDMQIDLSKTRLQIAKERLAFAEEILKLGDLQDGGEPFLLCGVCRYAGSASFAVLRF